MSMSLKDSWGAYQPALVSQGEHYGSGDGHLLHGSGAPSDSLGNNGDFYVDEDTGDTYVKVGGAWTASGGGSGGSTEVIAGAFADPNSNVTPADPTKAAIYYQDAALLNEWRWSVADQAWYQSAGA